MKNKYYFSLLSYDEQDKFVANFNKEECNIEGETLDDFFAAESPNFHSFIKRSFIFDLTNEGFDYWMNISNSSRCFEQWVSLSFNDLNTGAEKSMRVPLSYADIIGDEMIINGLIGNYKINLDEIE